MGEIFLIEWGAVSDWFEAVAELLAVCVALFLPMVEARKRRRATRKRIKQNVYRLTLELLEMTRDNDERSASYQTLQVMIRLYGGLLTDPLGEPIVAIGEELLVLLETPEPDGQRVTALLDKLAACR